MQQSYLVEQREYAAGDEEMQAALTVAYAAKHRPKCLCTRDGVDMYIADAGGRLVIKRMPDSGGQHAPDCTSFDPPEELSGLGQVARGAIVEDVEAGTVSLKLGFSFSKMPGRLAPSAGAQEKDSVRTEGLKLGIRALLHYLWEQAGLTSWSPAMTGKRSWTVVRRAVLEAATAKTVKGKDLGGRLYVPETFILERKAEIEARSLAQLSRVYATSGKARELMVLIGEVKAVREARFGFNVVVKHLPDLHFTMDDTLGRRMEKRFENELALWNADKSTHLVVVATFGRVAGGMLAIEELAFMLTTETWLPIDSSYDQQLLAAITDAGRRFRRGLRYNLTSDRPVSVAVLTDIRPAPVALYVVPPEAPASYRQALAALVKGSSLPAWVWIAGASSVPALPSVDGFCPEPLTFLEASDSDDADVEEEGARDDD
jgi:Protein of unknown function (DUF1173)